MAYNVPAVQISQEFAQLPIFSDSPLAALILGPQVDGSVTTPATSIGVCYDDDDVTTLLGAIVTTNPLAMGVHYALLNSGGAGVYFAVVTHSTTFADAPTEVAAYAAALLLAEKSGRYYGLVPMSTTPTVLSAIAAHVNAQSAKEIAHWRCAWFCPASTGSTTSAVKASYISAIPSVSSTSNGGPRRVKNVFPSTFTAGGVTIAGYYAAAALAGLRSGSVPHQSLTSTQVTGIDAVPISSNTMSEADLDILAGDHGVWIIAQDVTGGPCFTRHQLTGDITNLNYREDSVTANVDSISYGLQAALEPYKGIYNISPAAVLKIRAAVDKELSYRLTNTYTERAGNQLVSYKIIKIAQDATFKDKLIIQIQLEVPYPMNYIQVTLSI